jgi:hypothetical protein
MVANTRAELLCTAIASILMQTFIRANGIFYNRVTPPVPIKPDKLHGSMTRQRSYGCPAVGAGCRSNVCDTPTG